LSAVGPLPSASAGIGDNERTAQYIERFIVSQLRVDIGYGGHRGAFRWIKAVRINAQGKVSRDVLATKVSRVVA
jgi:hypothetical protein